MTDCCYDDGYFADPDRHRHGDRLAEKQRGEEVLGAGAAGPQEPGKYWPLIGPEPRQY